MGTETIGVSVTCAGGTTSCPARISVRKTKGTHVVINWNANGGNTFPTSGFFSWKSGSQNPGRLPVRSEDGKTLTLTYDLEATVTWSYNIKLESCDNFDPEIENQVPPTPDPEEDK